MIKDIKPGEVLGGRYRIISLLGKGGMGRVYRAFDVKLQEDVALKMVETELEDEDSMKRFIQEIKLARNVTNENVCRIFQFEELEGKQFISMQYIDGTDLSSFLKKEVKLRPEKALPILMDILRGLAAIHSKGIVHRDLKPANILIDKDGTAFISDFGIAKSSAGKSLTHTGATIGTPEYISPEQAKGDQVDNRSDIYSLGVMMYQTFSGRLPFRADSDIAMAVKHITDEPEPIEKTAPDLIEPLKTLIKKCMAKNRDERPSSAKEIIKILEGISLKEERFSLRAKTMHTIVQHPEIAADSSTDTAATEYVTAPVARTDIPAHAKKPAGKAINLGRRQIIISGTIAALAVITIFLAIFLSKKKEPLQQAMSEFSTETGREEPSRIRDSGALPGGGHIIPRQGTESSPEEMAKALESIEKLSGKSKGAEEGKEATSGRLQKLLTPEELKIKRQWDKWQSDFVQSVKKVEDYEKGENVKATGIISKWTEVLNNFKSDNPTTIDDEKLREYIKHKIGEWKVKLQQKKEVIAAAAVTGLPTVPYNARRIISGTDDIYSIAFSPDGKMIAAGDDANQVRVIDIETGKTIRTFKGHKRAVIYVEFTPDSNSLLSGGWDYVIKSWDLKTGQGRTVIDAGEGAFHQESLSLSPDGNYFALGIYNTAKSRIFDAKTWKELDKNYLKGRFPSAVKFSHSMKNIVFDSENGKTVNILETASGSIIKNLKTNAGKIISLDLSPSGEFLAMGGADGAFKVWELSSGAEVLSIKLSTNVERVRFSPDGKFILTSCGMTRRYSPSMWNLADGSERTVFIGLTYQVFSIAISPNGKLIAGSDNNGNLIVWDISRTVEYKTIKTHNEYASYSIDFSPDGKYLVSSGFGEKVIEVWNVPRSEFVREIADFHSALPVVKFSPNGRYIIVAADKNGEIIIKDFRDGRDICRFKDNYNLQDFSVSPDGRYIIADYKFGSQNENLLFDTSSCNSKIKMEDPKKGYIVSRRFSPDEKHIAGVTRESALLLWDAETGKLSDSSDCRCGEINYIDYSPDGKHIVTAGKDKAIRIWNADTFSTVRTIDVHGSEVRFTRFSPDGKYLLSVGDSLHEREFARVWSIDTGKEIRNITAAGEIKDAAFSPDGKWLAVAKHGYIMLYGMQAK